MLENLLTRFVDIFRQNKFVKIYCQKNFVLATMQIFNPLAEKYFVIDSIIWT